MSFTQAELDALRQAYASGALSIVHEGKRIDYGSEADLMRRIRVIEQAIVGSSGTTKRSNRTVLGFKRG